MALVPFDDRDGWIWLDGEFVPWREAKVHVLTHGLHYASAVFEGERMYGGEIFELTAHTERLFESARILDFEIPYTVAEIDQDPARGLFGKARQVRELLHADAGAPAHLTWAKYKRPSPETEPVHAKATGLYMICTISKHAAEKAGYTDAMMLDYRGYIAESTGSNVFFVKDGVIHTPTPDCFLNGITRQTVIKLAKSKGFEVVERHIQPEELAGFTECFVVGTAAEVTPVGEIGEYRFTPGNISLSLMDDYAKLVRRELVTA